jgi:hypothetical protein
VSEDRRFAVVAHGLGRPTKDIVEIEGVPIPVASKRTLTRTKNTLRPSDQSDVAYLEALIRSEK